MTSYYYLSRCTACERPCFAPTAPPPPGFLCKVCEKYETPVLFDDPPTESEALEK